MPSDEKKTWHGIPREDIPWKPAVDIEACIGCQLCYVTCGRGVFEMQSGVAVPVAAMECVVGCSTCANVCPTSAISFPCAGLGLEGRTRAADLPNRQKGSDGQA
jgi:NAD-dependent dihydropyrimidine dehydrogenase PreA subunit